MYCVFLCRALRAWMYNYNSLKAVWGCRSVALCKTTTYDLATSSVRAVRRKRGSFGEVEESEESPRESVRTCEHGVDSRARGPARTEISL